MAQSKWAWTHCMVVASPTCRSRARQQVSSTTLTMDARYSRVITAARIIFIPPGTIQNPNCSPFPWNPVQAGDSYGNPSKYWRTPTRTGLSISKRDPSNGLFKIGPADCIMEQWTHLEGPAVRVHCKLTNNRSDHTRYPPVRTGIAGCYGVGTLCHIFSYTGTSPVHRWCATQLPNSTAA